MAAHDIDFGSDVGRRTLQPGDVLCEEGDDGDEIYRIESGRIEVVRNTRRGPLVVAHLGPGAIVGEIIHAVGGSRTATLRAVDPTIVEVMTHEAFMAWQRAHPDEADELARAARHRLNRTRAAGVLTELLGVEHEELVGRIVDEVTWQTLQPGDVLFEQGDPADAAYVVVAGRLQVIATDDEGNVVLDRELGRGELVGELGIIEDAPRSASVHAIRDTTLASIRRETFEQFTSRHPNLMLRIFRSILGRITRRAPADDRARVVTFAITSPHAPDSLMAPLIDAVTEFGRTLRLGSATLSELVRDPEGPGGSTRVAEFLHEADVAHDYVVLQTDAELTPWSVSAVRQSDRFVVLASADPDAEERARIGAFLDLLNERQRPTAWIVRVHPSHTTTPRGSAAFLDDYRVGEVHNVRSGRADHLARIGRLATGNGRGVVLGGGGARGIGHIGALRALREVGLQPDRIAGASMGSVVAASAAKDLDDAELLEAAIVGLTDLLDYTLPLVAFIKAKNITEGMRTNYGGWDITDLWIPFYCVSTNLTHADVVVHRRGDLVSAVRASVAIPAVLPPVPIDGDLHVDGGVLDNIPVRPMHDDNSIGTVIAVDVSPEGGPSAERDFGLSVSGLDALRARFSRRGRPGFPDLGQVLMSSMLIGSSRSRREIHDEELVDLMIQLDLADVGLLKFENHAVVAQKGYDSAAPAIAAWLAARDEAGPTDSLLPGPPR